MGDSLSIKMKKVSLILIFPILLVALTACPGLVIERIQIDFGANGAVEGAIGTFTCISPVTGDVVTYRWTFGDGATAEGQTVTHSYASAGDYLIECSIITETAVLKFSKSITIELLNPTTTPSIGIFQYAGCVGKISFEQTGTRRRTRRGGYVALIKRNAFADQSI